MAQADDAQVTVATAGGEQRTLSLAALAGGEDVVERGYVLRSSGGEGSVVVTGFSLAAILAAAEADPYGFSYLEVQRPAGGSVLLSRHQALDPAAFADGPAALYATAAGTGFLRPSSGPGDLNATDSFVAPQGIALVLRRDSPLLVEVESSTLRTRPGQPVDFDAIVERAGSGEQLSFSWYFDDGHSASGATATHSFAKRGSYDVVVGVTTPGDRAGASAVVTIQVGAPLSGPDRKGGGRNRDAAAPDHGAATGTRGAVPPGPSGASSERHEGSPAEEPVEGELVSSVAPIDAGKSVAARRGQLEDDGESAGLPGAALGLLVTAGLLAIGALAELRGDFLGHIPRKSPQGVLR
ncbi:MAG TPA: PKD domain-containing protein [Solirubrobacterales bacterium]